jgi:hypothetical protein
LNPATGMHFSSAHSAHAACRTKPTVAGHGLPTAHNDARWVYGRNNARGQSAFSMRGAHTRPQHGTPCGGLAGDEVHTRGYPVLQHTRSAGRTGPRRTKNQERWKGAAHRRTGAGATTVVKGDGRQLLRGVLHDRGTLRTMPRHEQWKGRARRKDSLSEGTGEGVATTQRRSGERGLTMMAPRASPSLGGAPRPV